MKDHRTLLVAMRVVVGSNWSTAGAVAAARDPKWQDSRQVAVVAEATHRYSRLGFAVFSLAWAP